jgi:hypothetical protein
LTAYEILLSSTDQIFQIPLGGVTYTLTSKWCAPAAAWTLDIADANGVALVSGIPLVTGVDLLEQYQYLGIAGQLVAQTDGDTFAVPTQSNLGVSGRLYFVIADGAVSTPAPEVITYTPLFTHGVQAYSAELGGVAALATTGFVQRTGTATYSTALPAGALLAILEDQKASGTNGGTFTSGAWHTRDLNIDTYNRLGIVSISSNQFTISTAGTYEISWSCPAVNVGSHKTQLYNVTDAVVSAYGDSGYTSGALCSSCGTNMITISSSKTFEIQNRCSSTEGTNGFGVADSLGTEVYTRVIIRQG